jgi:outer membrane protein assembly factor BamB
MPRYLVCALVVLTLVAMPCAAPADSPDWPNWRGPSHDGISPEKGFQTKWEKTPPKLWEADTGSAYSAITCVAGKAYTCGTKAKQQVLLCFDAETGKVLWQHPIEAEFKEGNGDGTRATPTVNEGRVYILGALGKLLCCNAETGAEIWSQQLNGRPQWAYAGSVLIEGDHAIVTAGGDRGALLALEKQTGEEVWHSEGGPVAYSTPYPFTFEGQRYLVGFLAKEAIVIEAQTGRRVWSTPWNTDWDVNAASPIFSGDLLFLSSGYKTGSAVFKLAREGDKLAGQSVWGAKPSKVILGKFQSAVLQDGHLYVSDEKALKCVDFATGKEKWSQRGMANATVILADGHLVVFTEGGELQIAKVSAEKYEPFTKVQLLSGKCWTIPTLYNGRIYVRNLERAACYKLTRE